MSEWSVCFDGKGRSGKGTNKGQLHYTFLVGHLADSIIPPFSNGMEKKKGVPTNLKQYVIVVIMCMLECSSLLP